MSREAFLPAITTDLARAVGHNRLDNPGRLPRLAEQISSSAQVLFLPTRTPETEVKSRLVGGRRSKIGNDMRSRSY